jgi:hypothetical protein
MSSRNSRPFASTAQAGPNGQFTLVHTTQAAAGTGLGEVVASAAQNPETYPD